MKNLVRIACLLSVVAVACSYGDNVSTEVTRLSSDHFNPTEGDVELFFAPVEPGFKFQQIARVEVTGNSMATFNDLVEVLKNEAKKLGGDAVIYVEREFRKREEGIVGASDTREYEAVVVSGLVVRAERP
jgi:hypothetical protein